MTRTITCAILILALSSAVLIAANQAQTKDGPFVGVVTDTMCAGEHAMMGEAGKNQAKCAVDCVKANPKKNKYALLSGDKVYLLSDQQTPEQFAARKVKVTGKLYTKTNVIAVEKIEAAQ